MKRGMGRVKIKTKSDRKYALSRLDWKKLVFTKNAGNLNTKQSICNFSRTILPWGRIPKGSSIFFRSRDVRGFLGGYENILENLGGMKIFRKFWGGMKIFRKFWGGTKIFLFLLQKNENWYLYQEEGQCYTWALNIDEELLFTKENKPLSSCNHCDSTQPAACIRSNETSRASYRGATHCRLIQDQSRIVWNHSVYMSSSLVHGL